MRKLFKSRVLVRIILTFFCISTCTTSMSAGTNPINDKSRLSALINIANPEYNHVISSIIDTVSLFESEDRHFSLDLNGDRIINFVFVSKNGAINNGKINPDVIGFFEDDIIETLSQRKVSSDECYIDEVFFENGRRITVGIFNEALVRSQDEKIYSCLLIGLSYRKHGKYSASNRNTWRKNFIEILGVPDK